jgi:signal transduction histidine kinase
LTLAGLIGSIALAIFATYQGAPYLMHLHAPGIADSIPVAAVSAALTALLVLPIAMIRGRQSAINSLKPFLKLRTDLEAASQSDYPQLGRYQTAAANDVATAINRLSGDLRDRDIELEARRRRFDHDVETRMAEIKDAYASMEVSLAEAERVRREAERANHAKSDFLAKMSHEIRTPLNGILGAMDLMLNTGLTPRQQNYGTTIRASGTTLLDLLNGILDLAKIESGEVAIAKTDYDPTAMLDDIAIAFAPSAREKGLRIVSMPDPDLPHCLSGDSARVRQIVVNLVGNAVKFTASGSVSISAEWIDDGDRLDIDISDTGPGVPDSARDRIFERFEQGDGSMSRKFGGAGLGLAIARDLARRMGGDVRLLRSGRSGSTFRFSVPAVMVSRQPPALENSLFVLAAEATPDDQQSLLGRLARRGVDTAEADGAGDAAAMLENAFSLGERMPDIVIASGNDEQEVRRLRARLLKISDESRPKLCIVLDFGSEPLF